MWHSPGKYTWPSRVYNLYNDLPNCLENTTRRMFTDDTNLTAVCKTLGEAEKRAGVDLGNVQKWLSLNKLSLNIAKTEYILIASRHDK